MANNKIKSNWFHKFLYFFNILFTIALILSYISCYTNPNPYWLMPFFGLAYPYILLVNIFFILLWFLLLKWKKAIFPILIILLGYNHLGRLFQFSGRNLDDSSKNLKIVSFNVRLFNLYFDNPKTIKNDYSKDVIFDFLKNENPDIICFQEYYYGSNPKFKTTDSLIKILNTKEHFEYYPFKINDDQFFGISIFSKHKIINSDVINFNSKSSNSIVFVDIKYFDDTIRVYNAHLQSIRLSEEDAVFSDNNKNFDGKLKDSQKLFTKFKNAYIIRAEQVKCLVENIKSCRYKKILCGDFNDTPTSFVYQNIKRYLKDCFVESGKGFGKTYVGKLPSYRIDYIFCDDNFESNNFKTHTDIKISDHYPISTNLQLCEKKK